MAHQPKKSTLPTAILSVALVVVSCSTISNFPVLRPVNEQPPGVYLVAKAKEYYIRAVDYERRGLLKMAAREYESALQFDPDSKFLKQRLLGIYIEWERYTQALLLVKDGRKDEELTGDEKIIVSTIYLKMAQVDKAAKVLESILDKKDKELYTLGWIYEHLGNIRKSCEYYEKYYRNNPDASSFGFKIAAMHLQLEKYSMADSFLIDLQSKLGKSPEIFSLRGTVALATGDTSRSIKFLDSALIIDSLHEESLRNKAQIFIEKGDFSSAIPYYAILVENFTYGDVYARTLSLLYYYNHQFDESEKLLYNILQRSINDPQLHYYLGLVYAARQNYELAAIEFEKTLMIKNDYQDAWRELCTLYITNKALDKAASVARRYTESMPLSKLSWRMSGYIATLRKDYNQAVISYEKAVKIDSFDAYSWFELASALERKGEIERSERSFFKVLELRPDDPGTLNYLGYMWAEKGINLDTAKVFLEKALIGNQHNGAFLDSYAWIFFRRGEYDSAYVYISRAIQLINDDPVVFSHLGDILFKKGDYINAAVSYIKSIELKSEDAALLRQKVIDLEIILEND